MTNIETGWNAQCGFPMTTECCLCALKCGFSASKKQLFGDIESQKLMFEMIENLNKMKDEKVRPCSVVCHTEAVWNPLTKLSGVNDPYGTVKKSCNEAVLKIYPLLKDFLGGEKRKLLYIPLLFSAFGNFIDYGNAACEDLLKDDPEGEKIMKELSTVSKETLYPQDDEIYNSFESKLSNAKCVMLISDNAGEIVLDKFLLECVANSFPGIEKVIIAVRGGPVVNDIIFDDTSILNLSEIDLKKQVEIIKSSDQAYCGTILPKCQEKFLDYFWNVADVTIAKGHGNFESLCFSNNPNLFFLFQLKCQPVSRLMKGIKIGSLCFTKCQKIPEDILDW